MANGTDLRLRVGGRRWINASGHHNLPDGEVFTGPREDATEGVVTFAMPSAWGGQRVEGARLRFEAGRCVEASASSGEDALLARLDTDEGARTLGEFAFGLNEAIREPTLDTLLDEKIGGTVHMALGAAYAVTGGTQQERAALGSRLRSARRRRGLRRRPPDPARRSVSSTTPSDDVARAAWRSRLGGCAASHGPL